MFQHSWLTNQLQIKVISSSRELGRKLDPWKTWFKTGNENIFIWSANLVASMLRSGIPISVSLSHLKSAIQKWLWNCAQILQPKYIHEWVPTCSLYYKPPNPEQLLWCLRNFHCFMSFSLLFLSVSDKCFLILGGSLSPIHIFERLDGNIFCGISSLDIKYGSHVAEHTLFTFL